MQAIYNITADFEAHRYVLTSEGFKDSAHSDALDLETEEAARLEFDDLDAAALERDGWEGFHEVQIHLVEYTEDADEETVCRIVAEKTIIVDTK